MKCEQAPADQIELAAAVEDARIAPRRLLGRPDPAADTLILAPSTLGTGR